jgi:hypothetical protein
VGDKRIVCEVDGAHKRAVVDVQAALTTEAFHVGHVVPQLVKILAVCVERIGIRLTRSSREADCIVEPWESDGAALEGPFGGRCRSNGDSIRIGTWCFAQ